LAWYPVVAAPLLAASLVIIQQVRLSRIDLGLRPGDLLLQLLLMGGGMGLGAAEYYILKPEPLLANASLGAFALATLALFVATGFAEELIFRGLLQSLALAALGRWALVYVSLLFAVLHIGYLSLLDLAFVFAVGLLFAQIVRWSGSILGVTLAHGMTNTTLFLIMPQLYAQAPVTVQTAAPWVLAGGTALATLAIGVLWWRARGAHVATPTDKPDGLSMRQLRHELGLTYVGLALRSGLPARQIAEIEYGMRQPLPEELGRLALALGVATNSLMAPRRPPVQG
jgi:membrane protease YdiL (CAAX protease family)